GGGGGARRGGGGTAPTPLIRPSATFSPTSGEKGNEKTHARRDRSHSEARGVARRSGPLHARRVSRTRSHALRARALRPSRRSLHLHRLPVLAGRRDALRASRRSDDPGDR